MGGRPGGSARRRRAREPPRGRRSCPSRSSPRETARRIAPRARARRPAAAAGRRGTHPRRVQALDAVPRHVHAAHARGRGRGRGRGRRAGRRVDERQPKEDVEVRPRGHRVHVQQVRAETQRGRARRGGHGDEATARGLARRGATDCEGSVQRRLSGARALGGDDEVNKYESISVSSPVRVASARRPTPRVALGATVGSDARVAIEHEPRGTPRGPSDPPGGPGGDARDG